MINKGARHDPILEVVEKVFVINLGRQLIMRLTVRMKTVFGQSR